MRNNKVQELITQLNRLQLQQVELFTRLERAIDNEATQNRESVTNDKEYRETVANDEDRQLGREHAARKVSQTREFVIGNRVTIRNLNPFQANKGTVTRIESKRITVTTESGNKIVRAPKNLAF
jgi:hypothetical protein